MDKQEIFNKAIRALHAQPQKSYDEFTGTCFYRGPEGIKCAIGHLIPDEEYNPKFEGEIPSFSELPGNPEIQRKIATLCGAETKKDAWFLQALQTYCHDNVLNWHTRESHWKAFAEEQGLDYEQTRNV